MSDVFDPTATEAEAPARFADEARRAVYDAIRLRRDIRHFRAEEDVDDETLARVLGAAHLAPSVGFSQPWGFVVVRERETRARIRASFLRCREAEASRFPPARRAAYLALRLEGILEAPVNVCVAVDLRARGEAILGTTVQPEAVRASACCAVQNLWLSARVEGLGVGWVSIVEPRVLRRELALPDDVEPVAYLCIGHPRAFRERPMLEETGWRGRVPLERVVHAERWRDARIEAVGAGRGAGGGASRATPWSIPPLDEAARALATEHQRALTKPQGSLGRLEDLACAYAAARGCFPVAPPRRLALALFAADHGVVEEGVSAYSSAVTAAMLASVLDGGAAIAVLARAHGVELHVHDAGVAGDRSSVARWERRRRDGVLFFSERVAAGTQNLRREDAMTREEAERALAVGAGAADRMADAGVDLAGVGEIGIGNTTAAAALVAWFTGAAPARVVGRGTGIDEPTRAGKVAVVEDALARVAGGCAGEGPPAGQGGEAPRAALSVAAALGGLELIATSGFLLRAAHHRMPIVLDGFLSGAAALVAHAIDPAVAGYLVAAHRSAEPGAGIALDHLGLAPLFDLGLCLGEGTGAILGMALVRDAVTLASEMATFATASAMRDAR